MSGGQVVYLPGFRTCPHEEMVARMMIQDNLSLFHVEFHQTHRHLSLVEYAIKKETLHIQIRQSMTLVKK
jgi:hypothetical protein